MDANLQPGESQARYSSGDMSYDSSSPASPGYLTPPQIDTTERPRKKRVAWGPPEASHNRRKLSNQETEEDLRRALQQAFSDEAEASSASSVTRTKSPERSLAHFRQASSQQAQATSTPTLPRKKKPAETSISFQQSPKPKEKPKSVLRSETTPLASSSNLPIHDEATEENGKRLSALQARDKANKLQEHLGDTTEEELNTAHDREDLRRQSHGTFQHIFHDRDDDLLESGRTTPRSGDDHVSRPARFRLGGLSAQHLLSKLAAVSNPSSRATSRNTSRANSPERPTLESDRLSRSKLTSHNRSISEQDFTQTLSKIGQTLMAPKKKRPRHDADLRIKKHVQETRLRQRYILLLCRCLMVYGAPTHRLEDYLKITSRILEIDAQFLYLPGCMIVSFDDSRTHTAEVKLVKASESVDLGKLSDTHDVYKQVVHDEIGVEEAMKQLDQIREKPKKFKLWFLILLHGVASATVSPWAYQGRLIDLPVAFCLGCLLGFLRLYWAAKSDLYSAIFEIASVAITSFISRAVGSINHGNLFCFSTLASSSITLILPGYTILCAALELQSRSIVAGSVRMVFALVYSLFIGFSLTIGTAIYGIIDKNATSSAQCENPTPSYWAFFFVPVFTFCLMIINQAKWKQMPLMLVIAFTGYIISFFSERAFSNVSAVSSGLAAIAISVMANVYNRVATRSEKWIAATKAKIANTFLKRTKHQDIESAADLNIKNEAGLVNEGKAAKNAQGSSRGAHYTDEEFLASEKYHDPHNESGMSTPDILAKLEAGEETPRNYSVQKEEAPNDKQEAPRPRLSYSLAASAMLPAIFVLVPSGLSVQGSLVQGISTADQITNLTSSSNSTGGNGTGVVTSSQLSDGANNLQNSLAFSVGYSVIQIAIGITVGLFIGALIVYPFGKGGKWTKNMRSGLFSF